MPDKHKKFHEFALNSALFKGRGDWYFCYLKAERIAHACIMLANTAAGPLQDLSERASILPSSITTLAAGEADMAQVLSDIFALLSHIRICSTKGLLRAENAVILEQEYEGVAQRLMLGSNPSPFLSGSDFSLPALSLGEPLHAQRLIKDSQKDIKDISKYKGHSPDQSYNQERESLILAFIQKQKNCSIKDISKVIRGCSEKTIQRHLGALIERGLVRKVGERRWSTYVLA